MNYSRIIDKFYPEANKLRDILFVHSRGVADLSLELLDRYLACNSLEAYKDEAAKKELRAFVEAAAMLHDIGICKCDASGIECYGTEPYICHGRLGAEMLRSSAAEFGMTADEIEPYARVCERHTGAGLTAKEITAQGLPLPAEDMLPETLAEQLICYADKFYSKTHPEVRKTYEQAERSIAKFGGEGLARFQMWRSMFSPKIALLLSGGVDSAVVLHVLTEQGITPDCFYIKIGPEEKEEWDCTSEEDLEMATALCHKYKCRLEVIDCHQEYWDKVTTYTMEKVRNGFTPNPDVMCNRLIKFGAFHEKRGHEYDIIATGHYAQTEIDAHGHKWLITSPDPVKDQTDFLAQIYDWQLQKAMFPIGYMHKEEVRRIAEDHHLINARRKDSQGICFLGKIDYNDYLRRYLGEWEGDAIEMETGKVIGKHHGHWFHTIGQRKGLGFGGGPWFVIKKDIRKNIIYLSHGYDPESAYSSDFFIHDLHLLTASLESNSITFKIRHTADYNKATIEDAGEGRYIIHSEKPIHGVAPGQFCVIYDENHHYCYGSGEITL